VSHRSAAFIAIITAAASATPEVTTAANNPNFDLEPRGRLNPHSGHSAA
jgi:hypothetical protein